MILLMLSGGLDSTTALYKLLKETKDELHVHFIDYINKEHRHGVEKIVVDNIVKYCQAIRPFEFSTGIKDYSYLKTVPWDHLIVAFEAAMIGMSDRRVDKVAFGLEDFEYPNNNGWIPKWTHSQAVHDITFFVTRKRPEWIFPVSGMTKKQQFDYLPRDLYDLTWSCRTPKKQNDFYIPCNHCKTCSRFKTEGIPLQPNIKI